MVGRKVTIRRQTPLPNGEMLQVCQAHEYYAVLYDGQPINLRRINSLVGHHGAKYCRIHGPNPGLLHNHCEDLNRLFRTDKFAVWRMVQGQLASRGEG